jgi:hypothetical protein
MFVVIHSVRIGILHYFISFSKLLLNCTIAVDNKTLEPDELVAYVLVDVDCNNLASSTVRFLCINELYFSPYFRQPFALQPLFSLCLDKLFRRNGTYKRRRLPQ